MTGRAAIARTRSLPPEAGDDERRRKNRHPADGDRRRGSAVQFGRVEIHEFPPAIGHNPSVTAGVPITLGDHPIQSREFEVGDYERQRHGCRRQTRELFLPKELREEMLLRQGFDRTEIVRAIRAARTVRTNRKQTNDSRAIADVVEGAGRKLKRIVAGGDPGPSGPTALRLGPTNADLRGKSYVASDASNCDRTIASDSSYSSLPSEEFFRNSERLPSPRFQSKPFPRVGSCDRLPKLPTRGFSNSKICSGDFDSSDYGSDVLKSRGGGQLTTLRGALSLNHPHEGTSFGGNERCPHAAPRLPMRRRSEKSIQPEEDEADENDKESCRLVAALDVVDAVMQSQQRQDEEERNTHGAEVKAQQNKSLLAALTV